MIEEKKDLPKINLELSIEECTIMMMAVTAGMINIDAWQKTSTMVYGDKSSEQNTLDLIKRVNEIGQRVSDQMKALRDKIQPPPLSKV